MTDAEARTWLHPGLTTCEQFDRNVKATMDAYQHQVAGLERQLAEARAEVERLARIVGMLGGAGNAIAVASARHDLRDMWTRTCQEAGVGTPEEVDRILALAARKQGGEDMSGDIDDGIRTPDGAYMDSPHPPMNVAEARHPGQTTCEQFNRDVAATMDAYQHQVVDLQASLAAQQGLVGRLAEALHERSVDAHICADRGLWQDCEKVECVSDRALLAEAEQPR